MSKKKRKPPIVTGIRKGRTDGKVAQQDVTYAGSAQRVADGRLIRGAINASLHPIEDAMRRTAKPYFIREPWLKTVFFLEDPKNAKHRFRLVQPSAVHITKSMVEKSFPNVLVTAIHRARVSAHKVKPHDRFTVNAAGPDMATPQAKRQAAQVGRLLHLPALVKGGKKRKRKQA